MIRYDKIRIHWWAVAMVGRLATRTYEEKLGELGMVTLVERWN